jgi:hypothetical protein
MPYTYEDTLQGERRNAMTVPSSRREVLTEQFAQSFEENPILALKRFSDLAEDQVTGPRLPAETARARLKDAGMENDLVVSDAGITEAALSTLMERKRIEKRRQEIFARSEGGFGEGAARLGVAFATTLTDPVSAGLNFVPVVGQVRYARWLNAARSLGGRAAVRAGVGVLEGAAGAAIAEVPIYAMRTQEQADYDMTDSLLNVAFGGVIGAGLHTTVGSAAELISSRLRARAQPVQRAEPTIGEMPARAAETLPADVQRAIFDVGDMKRTVESMSPEAQQVALRSAVAQAVEGRPINVEPIVRAAETPTSTPEFREWFGESRVVDEKGAPLRVYHGTRESIDEFKIPSWFTSDPGEASRYAMNVNGGRGANVAPVFLALKNPYRVDSFDQIMNAGSKFIEGLKVQGYDGMVASMKAMRRPDGAPFLKGQTDREWFVPFESAQIKSSVGNSGRFDPRSASLTDPVDPDSKAANEHAESVLAREIEPTTEANLKAAEDEAALAEADTKALLDRLGIEQKPDEALTEALDKAERWARVAELATVCLVRGG